MKGSDTPTLSVMDDRMTYRDKIKIPIERVMVLECANDRINISFTICMERAPGLFRHSS
jgi:hypothetical protein